MNRACAADINPTMPTTANQLVAGIRVVGVATVAALRRDGDGADGIRRPTAMADRSTKAAAARYASRHDHTAVITPIALTPTNKPSAHDVSVKPITRLRRSNGTWSAIHEPNPTSNTILASDTTSRARVSVTKPVLAAANPLPTPTPISPPIIDTRRGNVVDEPPDQR